MASPTIVDIARAAGVSFKTVSRVINNQGGASKETRELIEATIAKLGYRPNASARSLRSTRSYTITLLAGYSRVSSAAHYVQQIQDGILDACAKAGYHMSIEPIRQSRDARTQIEKIIDSNKMDGLVLIPPLTDDPASIDFLRQRQFPFIRISPYHSLDVGSYIQVDDAQAAYKLATYLLELGHKDIAFIRGPQNHGASAERYRGFMAAMKEGAGHVNSDWILPGDFTIKSGLDAGEILFSGATKPTAVLASNDNMAIGVMSAAYRHGLTVPDEVSIAGIDGDPLGEAFWPQLTTMFQPVYQLAQRAAEILIEQINTPDTERRKVFKFKLIKRGSTAPRICR
jgi:LacI family transcriptional regulator